MDAGFDEENYATEECDTKSREDGGILEGQDACCTRICSVLYCAVRLFKSKCVSSVNALPKTSCVTKLYTSMAQTSHI
jgi:hypothetical protein